MRKAQAVFSLDDLLKLISSPPPNLSREDIELVGPAGTPEEIVERLKKVKSVISDFFRLLSLIKLNQRETVRTLIRVARKVAPKLITEIVDVRDAVLCDSIRKANGKRIVG